MALDVLVTGGAGFIGSHIVEALLGSGHRPVVVDDLSAGRRANLPADIEFHQLDIAAPGLEAAFAGHRYDSVVHCAAMVGVVQSMDDPTLDRRVNVEGTAALIALCRKYGGPKFVFLSSGGAIYGETPVPAEEDALPAPQSYYGVHKYCAEKYVELSGLPYANLRLANVYGPRQRAGLEGGVVAIFAERLRTGAPLDIYGSGEQERDFVYVGDVARAAMLAATTPLRGTWNVGTGVVTSVNGLWRAMFALSGSTVEVRYHPARKGEIIRSCLSIRRSLANGWWRPEHSLEEGLRETLGHA
ncbi:MAG: NAD-dependent epimerase/dehydratase family protein [Bacteroidetes bacterium]|nr:NAD-dependent epimerase/dehydratase family protein [Bacteroidota bacterium]MCL5026925.1 NAD-dependent epimerase/dehydratase family protein [Chloroflexota bacterium]